MDTLQLYDKCRQDGLVVFVGAGCSVAPPSSLPGWNDLNDMVLEVLWEQLDEYDVAQRHRDYFLSNIKTKRNENLFPPDYQAQLMAEQAGISYFHLLSAVDADLYNAAQYHVALLAKAGLVKAVVTTNFDRNLERAFEQQAVPFQHYFDEEGFNALTGKKTNKVKFLSLKFMGVFHLLLR